MSLTSYFIVFSRSRANGFVCLIATVTKHRRDSD